MKRVILFSFILLSTIISSAQTQGSAINEKNQKSLLTVNYRIYPTQNMWTFILLDQYNGKTWQVQWAIEPENRAVIPIK